MDSNDLRSMFADVDDASKDILLRRLKPELVKVVTAISNYLMRTGRPKTDICPPIELVMAAVRECGGLTNARVVLLGQDPYTKAGEAMGLSFSVPRGVNVPPSLTNIYKCLLHCGLITSIPPHGDLTTWARQGVLLLNCALTTMRGQSNAHADIWKHYTDGLLRALSDMQHRIVFILLGAFAQGKAHLIDSTKHVILTWGHPSPLNTANRHESDKRNFMYCDVFTRTNEALAGESPINWDNDCVNYDGALTGRITLLNASMAGTGEQATAPSDSAAETKPPAISMTLREFGYNDPLPTTLSTLWVFTDGASKANGRSDCRSSWGVYLTDGLICGCAKGVVAEATVAGKVYKSSNNRGELTAIYAARSYIAAIPTDEPLSPNTGLVFDEVVIVSDSMYCIDTLSKWVVGWLADPVGKDLNSKKNIDLIVPMHRLLMDLRAKWPVQFVHCRSHQTEPQVVESHEWFLWKGNDLADKLATAALM